MLMGADLSNILKIQRLNDDHIQFLVYQILRGLKVHSLPIFPPMFSFSISILRVLFIGT